MLLNTSNELDSTALADVISLYLTEGMLRFNNISKVALICVEESNQAIDSVRFSGKVLFDGVPPPSAEVLSMQLSSLYNLTEVQAALNAGGVDARVERIDFEEPRAWGGLSIAPANSAKSLIAKGALLITSTISVLLSV